MRLLSALFVALALWPVAACAKAAVEPDPAESNEGVVLPPYYFGDLEGTLEYRKNRVEGDFVEYIRQEIGACIQPAPLCKVSRQIGGYRVDYAACSPHFEVRGDFFQQCEGLIERIGDGTKLGCVYVLGRFPGQHGSYESAEVRMYFDAAGNWRLGYSPDELAQIEARNQNYEREVAAGTARLSLGPRYSIIHCSRDLNEFFEI